MAANRKGGDKPEDGDLSALPGQGPADRRAFVKTAAGMLAGAAGISLEGCVFGSDVLPTAQVNAPVVSTATSTVSVSSGTVASGGTVTLTLQAKDATGANVPLGGQTVVFTTTGGTSTGTIGATTDHADGTYTATLTGVLAGTATTIHATIGGTAVTSTLPTVAVTPGAISVATSTVGVSSGTAASGSAVTLTLQSKDAAGNNLTAGGATVVFSASGGTSTGTIGATTDHADGTYTATLTGVLAGTATTIHATIGGSAVTSALPAVTVTPGAISVVTSAVSVSSGTVPPNGTTTLTLQAKDAAGNNLTAGGATVAFTASGGSSTGTIGAVADNANGTYTATFTGGTAGTATTIHATINSVSVTSTLPTVTVALGAISPANSTVVVSSGTVASGSPVTATLQAKDSGNNNLVAGGAAVLFTATGGSSTAIVSATTDHADGTYTATLTGVLAGTATTVHATIGGVAVTTTLPTVVVTPGAVTVTTSTVSVASPTVATSGTDTLTLQAKDLAGNNLTTGGSVVVFSASGGSSAGTIGAVADNADGTYTATFTATTAGTATTIGATIGGVAVTTTLPTITVTSSAGLLFQSDWSTATGTTDAAMRDTGKSAPWTGLIDSNGLLAIVAATGKGFPAGIANILQVTHRAGTQASAHVWADSIWSALSNGQSLYFRAYLRNEIANSEGNLDLNSFHPFEVGTNGASTEDWEWTYSSQNDGTFPIKFACINPSNDAHKTRWCLGAGGSTAQRLNKNSTYRLEWKLTKTATDTYSLDIRIYGPDDTTLLWSSSNIFGSQTGDPSLAASGTGLTLADAALATMHLGTNGGQWTLASAQHSYWGGVMVRSDNWCGPY